MSHDLDRMVAAARERMTEVERRHVAEMNQLLVDHDRRVRRINRIGMWLYAAIVLVTAFAMLVPILPALIAHLK